MQLAQIIRYPLKSGRAESVQALPVEQRGLLQDRRWMVMNPEGRFLSARTHPALLSITARGGSNGCITLSTPGATPLEAYPKASEGLVRAQVWGDECAGWRFETEVDRWLSAHLGEPCALVFMPDSVRRPVAPHAHFSDDIVSYADGYPLLLTSESSLEDLNRRLPTPVSMANFRPNLVIRGAVAFEELSWRRIRIGDLGFEAAGACVRCILTTIDQQSGARRSDGEPLKSLATYKKNKDGVIFGINLVPRQMGILQIGDPVTVSG